MTSTQADIDRSYSVDNEFFALWLDENMHYTSAAYDDDGHEGRRGAAMPELTLEEAQERKARVLYDFAEIDSTKTVLDIGCGWGSAIDCMVRFGVRQAHGITLSTEQIRYCEQRNLPREKVAYWLEDYAKFVPPQTLRNANGTPGKYDGLVSIEMIDHLCSPAQAREGLAVSIYREYFNRLAEWVEPGACFGFQAILRNRIPRARKDLDDLAFTADVIFPGGLNPRIEELIVAIAPKWECEKLIMRRKDYRATTAEWYRRFLLNEDTIRARWGNQVWEDYDRYLSTCVKAMDLHWSGDVQMKLRRI
ncbi:MAG: class I SAM-dependent methyltransferase [Myxococcales bacterium]|nr:class I SAM-dependent methyltransferase [Myxococcales bacterium]